jgi:thioredoxin reductase (NADPH)
LQVVETPLGLDIFLANVAERVTLVHRNETFRGAPDSASKVFDLAQEGKIDLILSANLKEASGNDRLEKVILEDKDNQEIVLGC